MQSSSADGTRRYVVICGFREAGIDHLYDLLAEQLEVNNFQTVRRPLKRPDLDNGPLVLTLDPDALFVIGKLARLAINDLDLRAVIVVRDPRTLLTTKADWSRRNAVYGFDNALHRMENDFVSLGHPGLVYCWDIIRNLRKIESLNLLVVRYEDLVSDPDATIDMAKSFSLHANPTQHVGLPNVNVTFDHRPLSALDARRIVRQFRLAPSLHKMCSGTGYGSDRRWLDELAAAFPEALDETPGIIVGYYSAGTRYEQEARRLRASLAKLDLAAEILPISAEGDWLENVRRKPSLLKSFRQRLRGPLLYVDVDAVVHANPWPYLRGYEGDIAVASHHRRNIISGTLLLNDTEKAMTFLDHWITDQDRNPTAWDQHSLHNVVEANRADISLSAIRIEYLPPEMCRVFDRAYPTRTGNIIEHLQASREMRANVDDPASMTLLGRRRQRIREIDADLNVEPAALPNQASAEPEPEGPEETLHFRRLDPAKRRQRTEALQAAGASDVARWRVLDNFSSDWSSRAAVVASLVGPVRRVVDIGCGQMDLERWLDPAAAYIPCDIVARDARTIVCDLNAGDCPDVEADVATLLGVLEYIHVPEQVFAALRQRWPRIILTYNPADRDQDRDRATHGWFNALTSAELVNLAASTGLRLIGQVPFDARQTIYEFSSTGDA